MSAEKRVLVRVAIDYPVADAFDYLWPDTLGEPMPGSIVHVPFGTRTVAGVLWETLSASEVPLARLRAVRALSHDVPTLPVDMRELIRFAADYYAAPLGQLALAAIPPGLRRSKPVVKALPQWLQLTPRADQLELPQRAHRQRAVIARLREGACTRDTLLRQVPGCAPAIKSLLDDGAIMLSPAPVLRGTLTQAALNADQQRALEAITARMTTFNPVLLAGITGSGKTAVYLAAIDAAIRAGKQALFLVPEINLTPQLAEVVQQALPHARVALATSAMADGERSRDWLLAARGEADVVLGTRLSVFTPLPRLGVIVVDEEHDASYKQSDQARYSARDLAVWRAQQRQTPIVLGSATPSLESYRNALAGRYALATLAQRAVDDATLPPVRIVDTRGAKLDQGLSRSMIEAIETRLSLGEQSLIFLNRRGYAPVMFCSDCGWKAACPRCSANAVFHARSNRLRCHHCGFEETPPSFCLSCGNTKLALVGHGTERVHEALAALFPTARVVQIDRDTMAAKGAFAAARKRIHAGEVDIIIGTQMLAKGHDYPQLTLVGVLGADRSLYSTDFRAPERLFAMLTQVAGRAGRAARPGEVLIQSDFPTHALYAAVAAHDFAAFARGELAVRERAALPPYSHLIVLRAEARDASEVLRFLTAAREAAIDLDSSVELFDPVPATLARKAGIERMQLLARATERTAMRRFVAGWRSALLATGERKVRWVMDVDPLET